MSRRKRLRVCLTVMIGLALLSSGLALAGKPPRPPKLSDPKNLASSEITETSIELTWDSGGGEIGFKVGYLEDALPDPKCANVTPVDVGTDTSYVVTGLTPGATYGFRVCATKSSETTDGATLLVTLGGGGGDPEGPPVTYTATWLGVLPGFVDSMAMDINNNGVVVGACYTEEPEDARAV